VNPSTLLLTLLILTALAVACGYVLSSRRRAMSRMPGSFDCSIRVGDDSRRPRWRLGVAVLTGTALHWYPVFGLSRKPALRLPRDDMEIAQRMAPGSQDSDAVPPGFQIIVLRCGSYAGAPADHWAAMERDAVSAVSSWLESAPPGYNLTIGRFT